ncbi:hypothetical protein D3C78_1580470 [compost metagenome]
MSEEVNELLTLNNTTAQMSNTIIDIADILDWNKRRCLEDIFCLGAKICSGSAVVTVSISL